MKVWLGLVLISGVRGRGGRLRGSRMGKSV